MQRVGHQFILRTNSARRSSAPYRIKLIGAPPRSRVYISEDGRTVRIGKRTLHRK